MKFEHINAAHHNGNLHVKIFGDFCIVAGNGARSVISEKYQSRGNVFINTEQKGAVQVAGTNAFLDNMSDCTAHQWDVFMIGARGMAITPEGIRVILLPQKKKKCGKNCKCHKHQANTMAMATC